MATSQEVSSFAVYKVRGDQNAQREWTQYVRVSNGFVPERYDRIELGYTGADLTTVTYKLDGVVVAVLNLTYSAPGGDLLSVTRT